MKPLDKSLIVLSVLVALFAVQHLHALSCLSAPTEEAQLELDTVEADGESVGDLSAYDGYDAALSVSYNHDEVVFRVDSEDPDNYSYLQRIHRQRASSDE